MTKFMYCRTCKIRTNHKFISGKWLCWCVRVKTKPDGGTPSLERALHDAGFGPYGPM